MLIVKDSFLRKFAKNLLNNIAVETLKNLDELCKCESRIRESHVGTSEMTGGRQSIGVVSRTDEQLT